MACKTHISPVTIPLSRRSVFVFGVFTVLSTSAVQINPLNLIHFNGRKTQLWYAVAKAVNFLIWKIKNEIWVLRQCVLYVFYFLSIPVCLHLQNCGCHQHEWDQQQIPCRFHHRLHTEETWQWDRPFYGKGQRTHLNLNSYWFLSTHCCVFASLINWDHFWGFLICWRRKKKAPFYIWL